ncbi:hypothetical protein OSB04_031798 [Centaurea solstitialis]|uniref:Uncharacterized protein n=1 Tax=Centaurea solstitialis TaxID=347529 RepID=A0AA38SMU1_9ASTR|nr:hypothetical protein OSB04_031798 [Centaurea solstitialis]
MGDDAPMWTARRTAPTVPTNPITKPNLDKEIPGKLLHMVKDLTFDGKNDSNPIVHLENFVFEFFLLRSPEKQKLGYDPWNRVRSPLGKDSAQSSFPDSSHHPKLISYEPKSDPFDKMMGRQCWGFGSDKTNNAADKKQPEQ